MSREIVSPEDYTAPHAQQFVQDMLDAGLEPYHYQGRFWWQGQAVDVGNLQDALSATKIKCQWDDMGKDYVVYPVREAIAKSKGE